MGHGSRRGPGEALSSWADVDFGLQADLLAWGVAELSQSQTAQDASSETHAHPRLELQSGYRIGWQAGLGTVVIGPLGMVIRLGGFLTKMKFASHPEPLETQGFIASLGVSLDLGRGEL